MAAVVAVDAKGRVLWKVGEGGQPPMVGSVAAPGEGLVESTLTETPAPQR